jgi:hypothetical protein
MIKITEKLAEHLLSENKESIGMYFTYEGAFVNNVEFIIVFGKNIYLAHRSEFEQRGLFIRLKIGEDV